MPSLQINRDTGDIVLPNGVAIPADMTQDGFLGSPGGAQAKSHHHGTLPYIHYRLDGGEIEGKPLLVSLCFYDQMLLSTELTADIDPAAPKDWSSFSLETELARKRFHERLLEPILGEPTKPTFENELLFPDPNNELDSPRAWILPWGRVYSSHDSRGGGTSIVLNYGDRHDRAHAMYIARKKS